MKIIFLNAHNYTLPEREQYNNKVDMLLEKENLSNSDCILTADCRGTNKVQLITAFSSDKFIQDKVTAILGIL